MEITISKKYITLPVNTDASVKNVCFFENGTLLFDLECKLDSIAPNFTAYVDVTRFMGKTIEIVSDPEMGFNVGFSDKMDLPGLWQEPHRPQIHFSVPCGFNNDPNGLIYYHGTYHMFYQFNPCSNEFGHMHWGHAISKDLLHWEVQDVALFPDEMGAMFSGSAIEDCENVSGLSKNDKSPMLLYYTAAPDKTLLGKKGNKLRTQCLAYSNDGGKTFTKYSGNPIIGHIGGMNRDPKVLWVEEMRKFVMIIYLTDSVYQFLSSDNLMDWTPFQKVRLEGDRECPDLYMLMCNGDRKWVFSGASDFYLVGHFTENEFVIESEPQRLTYSRWSYAAQSISGTENGRVLRITNNKNRSKKYLGPRFKEQMGFPTEMHLEKVEEKYWLTSNPIPEIAKIYKDTRIVEKQELDNSIRVYPHQGPLDVMLRMPYVKNAKIVLRIFGAKIELDTKLNEMTFEDIKTPISLQKEEIIVRVIVDSVTLECFADNGRYCFTGWHISDYNLPYVELTSNVKTTVNLLCCHELASIHEGEMK